MEKPLPMFLQDNPFMVNTKNNSSVPIHLAPAGIRAKSFQPHITCNRCEGKSTGCPLTHVMRKHFKFINSRLIEPCRWIAIRYRVLAKLPMRLRRVMVPARLKPFGRVYNTAFEEIHVCSIDIYLKNYPSKTGIPCRLPALCNFPVLYYQTL